MSIIINLKHTNKLSRSGGLDKGKKPRDFAKNSYKSFQGTKTENLFKNIVTIVKMSCSAVFPFLTMMNKIGSFFYDFGWFSEAETVFKLTHRISEKALGPDHPNTAISLHNLAEVYEATGCYDAAEKYLLQSLAITEISLDSNHPFIAASLNDIAWVYNITGRYADAENFYRRSLAIREKVFGSDNPDFADSLNGMAVVYKNTGRYVEAENCFQSSLEIWEKILGPNHTSISVSLNNLAVLYKVIGRYSEAEKCFQRALTICEKAFGLNDVSSAAILNNLGGVCNATGRNVEAENYFQRTLNIWEKKFGPDHPDTAISLCSLAKVYETTGRYIEAENYFRRSLVIIEKVFGSDHPHTAIILGGLATTYEATGGLNAAILLRKRSINILQKVRLNVSDLGTETLSAFDKSIESHYEYLSHCLIKAGRYGEASFVMGMLKEKEHFGLLRRDQQTDLLIRTISYNDAESPLIAQIDELSLSFSALGRQKEVLKKIKNRTTEQNKELAAIKEKLIKVNQEFSGFLDNLHDALPPREVTQIDQDSYKLINMTDADVHTVAIFTVSAEDSFHVLVVTPHGRKAFSAEHKAVDIATKVLKLRELLSDPEDQAYLVLSQELYDIIIRPIEEELLSGGYTTILWMLSGVLRLLPIAALHDGKNFAVNKYQNVCITTSSVIGKQPHSHWNGLGMGVTLKHGDHSPLPAVKDELEGIISKESSTGVMRGDILLDAAFTRDAMESHLEDGYKAVHIASHFELNPANETMSYLLLGDGSMIRMDELRSMPRLFKGVDLVAFSACSTGLGTASSRGREIDGIGYLGETQGAKTVMATLWPVEDKSTSIMMREFYSLREQGMTKAEALQQAQLSLLNGTFISEDGHDYTHPYFWAPFILIGNEG